MAPGAAIIKNLYDSSFHSLYSSLLFFYFLLLSSLFLYHCKLNHSYLSNFTTFDPRKINLPNPTWERGPLCKAVNCDRLIIVHSPAAMAAGTLWSGGKWGSQERMDVPGEKWGIPVRKDQRLLPSERLMHSCKDSLCS